MLQDLGAERALLAGIVQYGYDIYLDVHDIIDSSSFSDTKNQLIFASLKHSFEHTKTIDIPILMSSANTLGYETEIYSSKNDKEYIRSLFSFPVRRDNVFAIGKKVAILSAARYAQKLHKDAHGQLESALTFDEILRICDGPSNELVSRFSQDSETEKFSDDIFEYLDHLESNPVEQVGIPTPFPIYNAVIGGGLRPGVHVLGARVKQGKSYIGLNIGYHIASLGIPVLYVDTEMQRGEQTNRLLSRIGGVDFELIETGKYGKNPKLKDKIRNAAKTIADLNYHHKNVAGKPFEEILAIMKRWVHKEVGLDEEGKGKPHFIIYDYIKCTQKEKLDKISEHQDLGFQTAELHEFTVKYNTPIQSFVQLNRDGINRDGEDVIAQSDRILWTLTSFCIYRKKTSEEIGQDGPQNGNAKITPVIGRYMKPLEDGDYINLHFDGALSLVKEINTRNQALAGNTGFQVE